jgi:hypothetical protein
MLMVGTGVSSPMRSAMSWWYWRFSAATTSGALEHSWGLIGAGPWRRMRPSHSAHPMGSGAHASDYFDRHPTRWGDKLVPIPFGRGIPFRGDALGSGGFAAAALAGV